MRLRRDAGAALFEFAVRFAEFCRTECGPGTVWNLGHARIEPGAYNVVPSAAELYVEYRDGTVEVLDRIRGHLPALARQVAHEHRVEACVEEGVNTVPAAMHAGVMSVLEAAAGALGATSMRMPSGAGHDAMRFAPLVPTGMMFVPSTGGRSHDVAEDTPADQIGLGLEVLAAAVGEIIARGAVPTA
jgi:N-carbamoyl-L-amino-acid hydrolase